MADPDPLTETYPLSRGGRACSQFRDTNWLAGAMMSILRQYFGTTDRISLEKGRFLWKPVTEQDPAAAQGQIQIDVVDNLKFAEGQKYPRILVDVENQEFPHDVIQDQNGYQSDGTINYFNQNQSAYAIECWGLKKLEASCIADEVRYFLQAYRHVIADKYQFAFLRVKTLMKPVKYKQFDDYWIARLIVPFAMHEHWGITQESLEVSEFALALRADPMS